MARVGAVITIDFDVPNPPLAWDEHRVAPHKTAHAAWAQGRGFEVVDGAKNELSIASVKLEATSVVLTLTTAPPAGTTLKLGYAMTQDGTGNQGGTVLGYRGQLRDSDELVGHDLETIEVQATNGSPTLVTTKGFVLRAGHDLVTGGGLPAATIVAKHDSDDQVTLSPPWTGATGKVSLAFHHDEHNYCVHFSLPVP